MKSVHKQLAKGLAVSLLKEAIRTVFTAKEGLIGVQSQLPLNLKQPYNISQNVRKLAEGTTQRKGQGREIFLLVMEQCKSSERKIVLYKK